MGDSACVRVRGYRKTPLDPSTRTRYAPRRLCAPRFEPVALLLDTTPCRRTSSAQRRDNPPQAGLNRRRDGQLYQTSPLNKSKTTPFPEPLGDAFLPSAVCLARQCRKCLCPVKTIAAPARFTASIVS